jgi:SAM-dependent methyltransferase
MSSGLKAQPLKAQPLKAQPGPDYFFGHSKIELQRLIAQSDALRPITERLLRNVGLRPGMRVLDLGCGAGDVSMLAAELVGPQGTVIGIDGAAAAIALARERAAHRQFANVAFFAQAAEAYIDPVPFDFVVGRYVVLHQRDPAAFIRRAAGRLRRGGVIAFHEIDMRTIFETLPEVPTVDAAAAELMQAIRAGVPTPDAAGRLVALFVEAGLALPTVFCERPAGAGAASPMHRWIAATLASVRSLQRPTEPAVDVYRLHAEMGMALAAASSQILGPDQCCAWTAV